VRVQQALTNLVLDPLDAVVTLLHGPVAWYQNVQADEAAAARLARAQGMKIKTLLTIHCQ